MLNTQNPVSASGGSPHFFVERVRGGLQPRVLIPPRKRADSLWMIFHLHEGSAQIMAETQTEELTAPALLIMPLEKARRIRVAPGSEGARLYIDEAGFSAAIGSNPQSAELRLMCDRSVDLRLGQNPALNEKLRYALNLVVDEVEGSVSGVETVIETQLRFILILIWRVALNPNGTEQQEPLLRRFRHLVEIHFRERWQIADYARELGTTPDQLHHVATTQLGRSPKTLVRERSIFEAKALLRQSNLALVQVAQMLGFASTEQFSKFFRHHLGEPPGKYRKSHQRVLGSDDDLRLDDWP